MIIHPGNCQHIGDRSTQQDAFGFSDKDDQAFVAHGGVLSVVADGMGGMSNGGEASHAAVRTFLHAYMAKRADETVQAALLRALDEANLAVIALSRQFGAENVGTTLVAAVICDDALHWLSVGDSHLYLWRNRQLVQLSVDHIYASELDHDAAIGNISCEDAKNHPERSSLTSYLGQNPLALIDQNPRDFPLLAKDRLLLCSDGLYAALEANDIATLIDREAQLAAEDLIALALAKGRPNQDNLTVAILACESDGMPATLIAPKMPPSKNYWGWLGCAVLSAMAGAAAWF